MQIEDLARAIRSMQEVEAEIANLNTSLSSTNVFDKELDALDIVIQNIADKIETTVEGLSDKELEKLSLMLQEEEIEDYYGEEE